MKKFRYDNICRVNKWETERLKSKVKSKDALTNDCYDKLTYTKTSVSEILF